MDGQLELLGMPARLYAVQWVFRYEGAGAYSATMLKHFEGAGWSAEERYDGLSAAELLDVMDAAVPASLGGLGAL